MITIKKNIALQGRNTKSILTDIFYLANNQKKHVVIFCHGFKGFKDWGAFNEIAHSFAEQGFVYVKFNFSHNGTNEKDLLNFVDLDAFGNNNFSIELDDLQDVINWIFECNWLQNEIDTSKISLIGHSRGGGIAILKAGEEYRLHKLISWSSPSNFNKLIPSDKLKDWKENGVLYVYNGRTHQDMPLYYQFYQDIQDNLGRFDISNACQNIKIPQMIMHGSKDSTVPVDDAKHLKSLNPNAELYIVDEADHVFNVSHPFNKESLPTQLKSVVQESIKFLKD